MKRSFGNLFLAAVTGLMLAASTVMAAGTIKIGVAGPHSGDLASYGIPTVEAVELVVKHVNAKGGILARRVQLVVEDDQCKPDLAPDVAMKLVSEGVHFVIGHICSGATLSALGIYKKAHVIAISPSATNPALTQSGDYPNFFRTIAPDNAQARLEVNFALHKLRLTKFAIIHDQGNYGKGLAEYVIKYLESDKRAKVVLFQGITPGAVDYSAIVDKIRLSGAQAVMFGGYHPEASKIVSQMRKDQMKTVFISDDGVKDDTFIQAAGKYAEGVYASGPMDVSRNALAIKATKEFQDAYKAKPGAYYLNAYAAVQALLNAIQKAGSTNYDAVINALHNDPVETPLGTIKFSKSGDATGVGFAMYQLRHGVFVPATK